MERFAASNFATHQEELDFLVSLGFAVSKEITSADSLTEVWQRAMEFEKNAPALSYQIDGMVVKLNDNRLAAELGVVGKTPRAWCAVKFSPQEVTTKLLDVTWQVGRTGRITPVAELEPVLLAGTTVRRATLHNYKEFTERKLRVGDTVVIRKAGEIIPEIVQVLENLRSEILLDGQLVSPVNCPSCGTKLVLSSTGVDLLCPNSRDCPAQILGRLSYFTQRDIGNIAGLSQKHLEKFVETLGVRDIPDLFRLPYDTIAGMDGFGVKSASNIQNAIQQAQEIPDYKFLAGLSIEGIGLEAAKLICHSLWQKPSQETISDARDKQDLFA